MTRSVTPQPPLRVPVKKGSLRKKVRTVFGRGLWGFLSSGLNTRGRAACSCCFPHWECDTAGPVYGTAEGPRERESSGPGKAYMRPRSPGVEDRFCPAEQGQQSDCEKKPRAGRGP